MASKPPPQIPSSNSNVFSKVSEDFSFHSSPEAFLVARILQHHKKRPQEVRERAAVRTRILNRNVIIVSSYHQILQVLDASDSDEDKPSYVAVAAYRQLMEDFFPPPNLLLQDGASHGWMKEPWKRCAHSLQLESTRDTIRTLSSQLFENSPRNSPVDLYDTLKDFAWKLFLGVFLDLSDADADFTRIVKLQEDLLRGQFSLLPVSVNVGFWHSPRKKGIGSRKALQDLMSERLQRNRPSWISADIMKGRPPDEIVNHILMATSSLAVKGFASLMLALLLNAFHFPHKSSQSKSIARWISSGDQKDHKACLNAVFNETMRLSPPIVGVMRRTTKDCTISTRSDQEPNNLIPTGFEAWCYFPGGNRDPGVFGSDADLFIPERYLEHEAETPSPIVFGVGSKSCLGSGFVRMAALTVLEVGLGANISIEGSVEAPGVRGWLGQEIAAPEQWAQDMKQLPTQRPSRPILVQFKDASPG